MCGFIKENQNVLLPKVIVAFINVMNGISAKPFCLVVSNSLFNFIHSFHFEKRVSVMKT